MPKDRRAHLHFEMQAAERQRDQPVHVTAARASLATGHGVVRGSEQPDRRAERGREPRVLGASTPTGAVFAFGAAPYLGGLNRAPGHTPVVALAPTPTGAGYWIVDAVGAVATFGDARQLRIARAGAPERRPSSASHRPAPALATGSSRTTAASSTSATRRSTAPPAAMHAERADHRDGVDTRPATATGSSAPTAASSTSATPPSTARPAR